MNCDSIMNPWYRITIQYDLIICFFFNPFILDFLNTALFPQLLGSNTIPAIASSQSVPLLWRTGVPCQVRIINWSPNNSHRFEQHGNTGLPRRARILARRRHRLDFVLSLAPHANISRCFRSGAAKINSDTQLNDPTTKDIRYGSWSETSQGLRRHGKYLSPGRKIRRQLLQTWFDSSQRAVFWTSFVPNGIEQRVCCSFTSKAAHTFGKPRTPFFEVNICDSSYEPQSLFFLDNLIW